MFLTNLQLPDPILAAIVYLYYQEPDHSFKAKIRNEIKAVFDLFESLPIDQDLKTV